MCGIAGYFSKKDVDNKRLSQIFNSLKHRGPDSKSLKSFRVNKSIIKLLHTRLSIIDLNNRSSQPMRLRHATIIFNGEIYNYVELKETLKKKNYKFKTKSDTEVLLAAYLHWGENFTSKINGMWSIAIWDSNKKKLLLSRDRFGEKPLFFSHAEYPFDSIFEGSYFV